MTEEEMRIFEQRAPTTLPQERPSHLSWDGELFYAAQLGDIPRMARALDHGASPKALAEYKNSVAHCYAYGMHDDAEDMRCHFASAGIDQDQAWAWLKARKISLSISALNVSKKSILDALCNQHADLAHPIEAKSAEVNMWALWKNVSYNKRLRFLSQIDTFFPEDTFSAPVPSLEGLPPFTSSLMQEAVAFEGIDRSPCGKPLSVFELQSRILALSSLLGTKHYLTFGARRVCIQDYMNLGLWASAPAPIHQALVHLPSYRPAVLESFTQTLCALQKFSMPRYERSTFDHAPFLARRLARGTRVLVDHGFDFPQEILSALLTLPEVRPVLEERLLEETLDEKGSEVHAPSASRSRVRL